MGRKRAYTLVNTVILVVLVLYQLLYGGITVWLNMGHGPLLVLWFVLLLSRGYFFVLIVGLIFVSQTRALQLPCDIEPAPQQMLVQLAPPSV
jgi:hypothetical protein